MSRTIQTRIAVLIGLTVVLLLLATTAVAAPRDPVVSGTVLGSDGIAIPGATVVVNRLNKGVFVPVVTLTANGSGSWTYSAKANTYRFDISAPNADATSVTRVMARDGVYTANVTLQAYGAIAGVITALPGGTPLGGATVELYKRNGDGTWPATAYATAVTAADGSYASGVLPTGDYAVKAGAAGFVGAFLGGADDRLGDCAGGTARFDGAGIVRTRTGGACQRHDQRSRGLGSAPDTDLGCVRLPLQAECRRHVAGDEPGLGQPDPSR